tara:strand:- start:2141 stop:2374 length:234 start_codon:yes stop_codon:yes gene_type:complete
MEIISNIVKGVKGVKGVTTYYSTIETSWSWVDTLDTMDKWQYKPSTMRVVVKSFWKNDKNTSKIKNLYSNTLRGEKK